MFDIYAESSFYIDCANYNVLKIDAYHVPIVNGQSQSCKWRHNDTKEPDTFQDAGLPADWIKDAQCEVPGGGFPFSS